MRTRYRIQPAAIARAIREARPIRKPHEAVTHEGRAVLRAAHDVIDNVARFMADELQAQAHDVSADFDRAAFLEACAKAPRSEFFPRAVVL